MLGIIIKYEGAHPLTKRMLNPVMREMLAFMGRHWHKYYLPKHFTEAGFREYRYTRRSGQFLPRGSKGYRRSYYGRKEASPTRGGGPNLALPLVNTGLSMRLCRIQNIKATSKRVKVILHSGFNRRHRKSNINMRAEVTRVSKREDKELSIVANTDIHKRLAKIKTRTTKTLV